MDQVCTLNELQQQLKVAGEQLSTIPRSTENLLHLLDKMEHLLTIVGQAPSSSMQVALVPSMGALIADELLGHSEVDVRVSVASCLCEIARITAPEQPYKDSIMKEIFELNVMAFGQLSHVTSHSYYKAIHILESVAKVKSCLLMLDLECDALIFAMFEQFLGTIRSNHPHAVFSNMEAIMTLVIEESDEISMNLLSLILSHVRKENQNLSPVSWKLAEKVLRNCSDILEPYSKAVANSVMTKKLQYIDTQSDTTIPKKRDRAQLDEGYHKHRLKGRPKKKKNILNQDSTVDLPRAKSPNKASIGFGMKEKSEGMEGSRGKPPKGLTKTKGVGKSNGKDFKGVRKFKGHGLVGHRIKVWWPLDKMFYEGAVSSYDSSSQKHTVLYADGDEETLDLRHQLWRMLDDVPPDQEQGDHLTSPATLSVERPKEEKTKTESSSMQEDTCNLPKSKASASPAKELDAGDANDSTTKTPSGFDYQKDDSVGECHTNRTDGEPNGELENMTS